MESCSGLGRINCSKASADILQQQAPHIPLTSRGMISVKGKGNMLCFWVGQEESHEGPARYIEIHERACGLHFFDTDLDDDTFAYETDLERNASDITGETTPLYEGFDDEEWVPGSFVDV